MCTTWHYGGAGVVLRRPRPAHKSLGDSLARSSPAQELGEGGGCHAIGRDRGEEGEHRQALAEVDVLRLLEEARVPAKRSPLVLRQLSVRQQERELEGFC
jgi:hypothetical protein